MKLTAGREFGGGENDGGVAKGLQVEASVGVALQIQRGDDLRCRLPLLRARERHGLSGWWLALALFVQPRCLFDQSKPRCLMNNPRIVSSEPSICGKATEPTARIYPGVATDIQATKRTRIHAEEASTEPTRPDQSAATAPARPRRLPRCRRQCPWRPSSSSSLSPRCRCSRASSFSQEGSVPQMIFSFPVPDHSHEKKRLDFGPIEELTDRSVPKL